VTASLHSARSPLPLRGEAYPCDVALISAEILDGPDGGEPPSVLGA
jgi:hypothetical protein